MTPAIHALREGRMRGDFCLVSMFVGLLLPAPPSLCREAMEGTVVVERRVAIERGHLAPAETGS